MDPSQASFGHGHSAGPYGWPDVASDIGVAYVAMLKEAPLYVHISLVAFLLLALGMFFLFRLLKLKYTNAARSDSSNVPIDALIQVISEASNQATSSAAAIHEVSEHLAGVVQAVSTLGEQVKSVTTYTEQLFKQTESVISSVADLTKQVTSMNSMSVTLEATVSEVREVLNGCRGDCFSNNTSQSAKRRTKSHHD